MTSPIIAKDKAALRRHMLALRTRLARSQPLAGQTLARRFPISLVSPASVVAGYIRLGSEIDPAPLLARLRETGVRLVLPCLEDGALVFRLWRAENSALVRTRSGWRQLPACAPQICPDRLLVPLLAFDAQCNRLGRGGGHYDRALAGLKRSGRPPPLSIGLAYEEQHIGSVPVEPHDIKLDRIETPLSDYCHIDPGR